MLLKKLKRKLKHMSKTSIVITILVFIVLSCMATGYAVLNQKLNIFGNAIKFTPENGTIATSLKSTDDGIYVSISDTGIGMSNKVKKRIFEKFYQGDSSRNFEGNGLGLTLVKRIIDLCGCDITVESEVNKGTKIKIELPNLKEDS